NAHRSNHPITQSPNHSIKNVDGYFSPSYPVPRGPGIVTQIDAVSLYGAAGVGGYRVPVAIDIQTRAERNKLRIHRYDAMSDFKPGCSAAGAAPVFRGASRVTGGDHVDGFASREIAPRG